MAAYTDATKIAAYLGVTLTPAQQTQAGIAAQAASDWIDTYKGRSWQVASPVADELHSIIGDRVYLNNSPATAVSSVKTRPAAFVGFGWTTLDASQYELIDAAHGVLQVAGWSASSQGLVQVTYTHTGTMPPSQIGLAATIIAASLLGPTLRPNTAGIDSVSVGQNDIAVKFSVDYGDVPPEALTLLGGRAVVIA